MTRLTRRYTFSASHRLHSSRLSESENVELYGKCNNPYGHGHNYVLEVSVRGAVSERSGRVIDPASLDAYVVDRAVRVLDHKDMNSDVPQFGELVPTTENTCLLVERLLGEDWDGSFPGLELDRIRLHETRKNVFELRNE